ncbi:PhoH family protein [Candidatus Dojkabacteria bacterium]|jgi:phosphate starvation-inducible PhoH-like protein|nr:PhoH family protein [Candidatus Dojkabacteria bacterium]
MARKPKEEVNIDKKMMTLTDKDGQEKKIPLNNKQIAEVLYGKNLSIRGKNARQKELLTEIGLKEITIAVGPAGVGKSYLSVAKALELLASPDNNYQKIYITTPTIEVEDSIGYLPGDMDQKMEVYLFSTYYLIDKIIGKTNRKKLQELKIIEPLCLSYIRGCNIDNAILIAEECQNMTVGQVKTLLTRIGFSSKFIVSGDLEQIDRKYQQINGLQDALNKFSDMKEIGIVTFEDKDIVRNPLIGKILSKY